MRAVEEYRCSTLTQTEISQIKNKLETEYKNWIAKNYRRFLFEMEFNGDTLTTDDITDLTITSDLITGDTFQLGTTAGETLEFTLVIKSDIADNEDYENLISRDMPVIPYILLYTEVIGNNGQTHKVWQKVRLGEFYVNDDGVTKKGFKSLQIKASSKLLHQRFGGKIYVAPPETETVEKREVERVVDKKDSEGNVMLDENGEVITEKVKVWEDVTVKTFSKSFREVIKEICNKSNMNISVNEDSIPNITITKRDNINGMTYRELIEYAALLNGGYARINYNSGNDVLSFFKLSSSGYTYTSNDYISLSKEDAEMNIKAIQCLIEAEKEENGIKTPAKVITAYMPGKDETNTKIEETLEMVCPDMTQSMLNNILAYYTSTANEFKYKYYGSNIKIIGNPRLEVGDVITVVDNKNRSYNMPIHSATYKLTGNGLTIDIRSIYRPNSIQKGNSIRKAISELQQDIIMAKTIVTDQIEASIAKIDYLEVQNAKINGNLTMQGASLKQLDADFAKFDEAVVKKLELNDLIAETATITKLNSDVGEINDLYAFEFEAEEGSIKKLSAAVADIQKAIAIELETGELIAINAYIESLIAGKTDFDYMNVKSDATFNGTVNFKVTKDVDAVIQSILSDLDDSDTGGNSKLSRLTKKVNTNEENINKLTTDLDENYYTKTEADDLLNNKADKSVVSQLSEDIWTLDRRLSEDHLDREETNSALDEKVDKVQGKSLISDTEIARLEKVDNYDDSEIRNLLDSKANKDELHSHDNKTAIDLITIDKMNKWNNKSEFSGSYNDLEDKPTIPSIDDLLASEQILALIERIETLEAKVRALENPEEPENPEA